MEFYPLFALAVATYPILLCLGIFLIPRVSSYADHDQAALATRHGGRWFWGHLLSALAFGYGIVAACCLAAVLFNQGMFFWAGVAVPLMAAGAALQAFGLGADGIGPLALAAANQPARLFFDGSGRWVVRTFIAGAILFSLGQIALVIGFNQTDMVKTVTGVTLLAAAIVASLSTAVPASWGLMVNGVASLVIYLPLSLAVWQAGGSFFP